MFTILHSTSLSRHPRSTARRRSTSSRRRRRRRVDCTFRLARGASSSSSCIGSSRAHRDSRDVAFTRAIIRARVVVVVDRRAPRCDIGGASSDVIDDKKRGGVATGVRVVASRDRGGGWRVVVVVVVVVVRVICGVAWWGHGVVGARCVDVVVEDGRRGTTRLDKKRFETTRARG